MLTWISAYSSNIFSKLLNYINNRVENTASVGDILPGESERLGARRETDSEEVDKRDMPYMFEVLD